MNKPLHKINSKCDSCGREGLQNWKPSFGEYCNHCNPNRKTKAANNGRKQGGKRVPKWHEHIRRANPALYSKLLASGFIQA